MTQEVIYDINDMIDKEKRLEYTRKAFRTLPEMEKPNILDVGCGVGQPTLELAKLSDGNITGIDIDQGSLDRLEKRAEELGFSDRIKTLNMSLLEMDFPDESFDLIWAEFSLPVMGLEKGLEACKRFIKPRGFIVLHEMCWVSPDTPEEIRNHFESLVTDFRTVQEFVDAIPPCGYDLIGHFALPDDIWWHLFYAPIEERMEDLRSKYKDDSQSLQFLAVEQKEIDLWHKYPDSYTSVFLVMQKR